MKPGAVVFSIILALTLLALPSLSYAQQPGKVYRIGWLGTISGGGETDAQGCPQKGLDTWQAGLAGLRERGYIRGQNLRIECRWTEGRDERAQAIAAEVVSLKPDLIVAVSTVNTRAAKQATSTIPIVMVGVIDPVGRGLVPSLARPGGNVTGVTDTVGGGSWGNVCNSLRRPSPQSPAWPSFMRAIRLSPSSGAKRRRRRGRST